MVLSVVAFLLVFLLKAESTRLERAVLVSEVLQVGGIARGVAQEDNNFKAGNPCTRDCFWKKISPASN